MGKSRQGNFFYLFYSLLLLLFFVPVATDLELFSHGLIRALGMSMVLAIGVWSLQGCRRSFLIGMFLALAGIMISIASAAFDSVAYGVLSMLIFIVFLAIAILESLRKVVFSAELTTNRLVGAVCVYLMLGLMWGVAFAVLHLLAPDSFRLLTDAGDVFSMATWNYYSFVTLTTLGYGEIVPVTATARVLATTESVFGQLYIAIFVAGLVGGFISERQRQGPSNN